MMIRAFNPQNLEFEANEDDQRRILDWAGPIDLEIGAGVGYHAISRARNFPERMIIAVEKTRNKFSKFESRLRNHSQFQNLMAVNADVIVWLAKQCPAVAKFENIFLMYPNPNPKNRAQRWFCMPFFGYMLTRLSDSGRIHLVTNEEFYINEAHDLAPKWGLKMSEIKIFNHSSQKPRTHFEKKYLESGQNCFESIFQWQALT